MGLIWKISYLILIEEHVDIPSIVCYLCKWIKTTFQEFSPERESVCRVIRWTSIALNNFPNPSTIMAFMHHFLNNSNYMDKDKKTWRCDQCCFSGRSWIGRTDREWGKGSEIEMILHILKFLSFKSLLIFRIFKKKTRHERNIW